MIEDVDASLRAALSPHLPSGVEVDFEPPGSSHAKKTPRLTMFLLRVNAVTANMVNGYLDVRDDRGRVVARRRAPRRYALHYLVSASGDTATEEHALLGRALTVLGGMDVIPPDHVLASLTEAGSPVTVHVVDEQSTRHATELWTAFGTRPRPFFELALNVVVNSPTDALVSVPPAASRVAVGVGRREDTEVPRRTRRLLSED
ncbi:Pvc16 family protein [Lentzea sp. NPDC051208]|uniref:Pvc16 family protein n=1 Tax=Lentzea sp. NPDC051208 TaxID=3154642 RepID=UPI00343BB4BE